MTTLGLCGILEPMTAENLRDDAIEVEIPRSLYEQLEENLGDSTHESVPDFVVNLFRILVQEARREGRETDSDDEETIRSRLKLLGYI